MALSAADHPSRSLMWSLLESGGLSLLSLAMLLVVARLVGPAELGAFAVALGIIQILTLLVEMLVHDALIQRKELDRRHTSSAFWLCLAVGVLLTAACWLAGPWLGRIFGSDSIAPMLAVASLSVLLSGIGCVPLAILRRELRFKPVALRSLYGRLCGAIAAVALLVAGGGVWSLVAQHVVQAAVGTLMLWSAISWRPALSFSGAVVRELLRFGAPALGTRLVFVGSARIFVLLVGHAFGVAAVGYFNIAQRVVDTLYDLMAGAAYNLALPHFSRRQDDRAAFVRVYSQATEYAAIVTQPVFAGLALCAAPAVAILLGDEWLPAVPMVQLFAVTATLQFVLIFAHAAVNALGRPSVALVVSLVSLGSIIAAFFVVGPGEILGAAAIWAGRVVLAGPILLATVYLLFGLSPKIIAKSVLVPLCAVTAMTATLLSVEHYFLRDWSPIAKLAVMVPLGAAVYAMIIALIGRKTLVRLLHFVGAGIGHRAAV